MTTEQLADTFKGCGTIVDSIVKMDGRTGRSRGFGVVEFSDPKEAEKAIDEFHNKNIGSGDGRPLVVRYDREGNRGGGGFGGYPPQGGYGGGGYGGGGYGGGGQGGGYGGDQSAQDRPSGAKGWEDRSHGNASQDPNGFDQGRSRRRRGASPEGAEDVTADYGGAES